MYCPECGFHQSEAHRFCGRCGARLIIEGQGTGEITGPLAISDEAAAAGTWSGPALDGPTLAVRAGGPPGAVFRLTNGPVAIGREPTSQVFLDDVTVSRRHALIELGGASVTLKSSARSRPYVNRRARGDEHWERRRDPDRQVPSGVSGRVRGVGVPVHVRLVGRAARRCRRG